MRGKAFLLACACVIVAACGSSGDDTTPSVSLSVPEVSRPPRTDAPDTSPDDTEPALTDAPPDTEPDDTEPPRDTDPPRDTEPDSNETDAENPDTTTVDTTDVESEDDDGGTVWWPWVLGAALLIGVVLLLANRRRTRARWQDSAAGLLSTVDELTNHLAAMTPEGLRAVAAADAQRLAALRAQLATLIDSAPTGGGDALLALSAPLADLHGTLDSIAFGSVTPSDQVLDSVRLLAARLHTASASARALLVRAA